MKNEGVHMDSHPATPQLFVLKRNLIVCTNSQKDYIPELPLFAPLTATNIPQVENEWIDYTPWKAPLWPHRIESDTRNSPIEVRCKTAATQVH